MCFDLEITEPVKVKVVVQDIWRSEYSSVMSFAFPSCTDLNVFHFSTAMPSMMFPPFAVFLTSVLSRIRRLFSANYAPSNVSFSCHLSDVIVTEDALSIFSLPRLRRRLFRCRLFDVTVTTSVLSVFSLPSLRWRLFLAIFLTPL